VTAPPPPPGGRDPWFLRPRIVFPVIIGAVILVALLAPDQIAGRTGNSRLSTNSSEPQGAKLFYELSQRLGWQVEQRRTPDVTPSPPVIHAVLDPASPLRMSEAHALLEHVRQGGALLLVLGGGDPIAESLHVATGPSGHPVGAIDADSASCTNQPRSFVPLWPDDRPYLNTIRWRGEIPAGIRTFLSVDTVGPRMPRARPPRTVQPETIAVAPARPVVSRASRAAAVGFPYGLGRIVVGADPDLLRNDVLRACGYGVDVPAVRMLEYLRDGGAVPRDRIVFDEYHQGYGAQPGTVRGIAAYLSGTPSGHLLFQLLGAGLVLLLAAAPRAVPPTDVERIERRSPLEHVDALARAYLQVGATRTAMQRLLRGVRRRVERSAAARTAGRDSDEAFLTRAQEAAPRLAPDIAVIRRALATPIARREFATVGAALQRLELTLTRT
jgi:uncharacterized protein DUF4350